MRRTNHLLLILLAFAVTPTANAQFFGLGWNRNPPPSLPDPYQGANVMEDRSCVMGQCIPRSPLGYHRESWRRWPGTDSVYSATPGLPQAQSETSLPKSEVPDSLNETKVIPRKKAATSQPTGGEGPGIDVIPTAPGTDIDLGPSSEDTNSIPDDIIPDSSDSGLDSLPGSSDDDLPSGNDSSPGLDPAGESAPGDDLDSLFPSDDDSFDLDDLGAAPRRIPARTRKRSLSHFHESGSGAEPPRMEQAAYQDFPKKNVNRLRANPAQLEPPLENSSAAVTEPLDRPQLSAPQNVPQEIQLAQRPAPQHSGYLIPQNVAPQNVGPQNVAPQGAAVQGGAVPQNYVPQQPQQIYLPQQQRVYVSPNQYYIPQPQFVPQYYTVPPQTLQQQPQVMPAQVPEANPAAAAAPKASTVQRAAHFEVDNSVPQRRANANRQVTPRRKPNPLRSNNRIGSSASYEAVQTPPDYSHEFSGGSVEFPVDPNEAASNAISQANPYR